jgi:hypothetical protein
MCDLTILERRTATAALVTLSLVTKAPCERGTEYAQVGGVDTLG